ncbi:hypothetical protein [Streptomyces sp. NPDC058665]|uniref:hypothetical protein n=1 Tax=Streptomyces sp. NPDC058665 TaxID=3346586 RepID=UPI00364E97DB
MHGAGLGALLTAALDGEGLGALRARGAPSVVVGRHGSAAIARTSGTRQPLTRRA